MTLVLGAGDVERFRGVVTRRLGLQFEDAKLGFLGDTLSRRLDANGRPCEAYLQHLESQAAREEWSALAQQLTVAETYFFRNIAQFRAFSEVSLPNCLRARSVQRRLRILSAGCASGEEPYSLAILLSETATDPSWDTSILAIDVNPAMLERAGRGRFSSWALRETPAEVQERWFRPDGRDFLLDDSARASVHFEVRNLADDDPTLWQPEAYDIVFCRNVLMYFTPDTSRAVVARIARALAPNGYLFLGHAETLRDLSNDFHLRHTHGTFYYQRKERIESVVPCAPSGNASPAPAASDPSAAEGVARWIDAIRQATERIQVLADTRQPEGDSLDPDAGVLHETRRRDLRVPLELLRRERFAEALALVEALPPGSACDPEVLLLQAVLFLHSGELGRAEDACRRLLAADGSDAGAHYALALCRERAGDDQAAVDHDRAAVYLDPGFAMPRLHVGMLARRAGDAELARRELAQAATLLQREDASHLLLFGGGFSREALITLCRAELLACGGKP